MAAEHPPRSLGRRTPNDAAATQTRVSWFGQHLTGRTSRADMVVASPAVTSWIGRIRD
ncbi:hypothetical protein MIC448_1310008 [Microbacterium sp. C448]|nr:hypothetical protein MIC448_1310008 [Microbacterium sp. C448]